MPPGLLYDLGLIIIDMELIGGRCYNCKYIKTNLDIYRKTTEWAANFL